MKNLHTTADFEGLWSQADVSEILEALADKCREESSVLEEWPGEGYEIYGWYSLELDKLAAKFKKGPGPLDRVCLWVRRVWWDVWASKRKGGQ